LSLELRVEHRHGAHQRGCKSLGAESIRYHDTDRHRLWIRKAVGGVFRFGIQQYGGREVCVCHVCSNDKPDTGPTVQTPGPRFENQEPYWDNGSLTRH
jgi:hypothetical protein